MSQKFFRRPVIGIPCDVKLHGQHPFHSVGEKYIAAIEDGANVKSILLPVPRFKNKNGCFDISVEIDEIFALCDGIVLTGSYSNVHPKYYGGMPPRTGVLLDDQRDTLTLDLIRACVSRVVPLFCICRGFQELNVAFGGTLHQHLQEIPSDFGYCSRFDHRENKIYSLDRQYEPAHDVNFLPGGIFEKIVGERIIRVNSLHEQGIANLADCLIVEGRAPDGTVEAVSIKDTKCFIIGVQWHPEWQYWGNSVSKSLFRAFGDAVREAAAVSSH